MSSIPYYNRWGSFWDVIAELEGQGTEHPFFGPIANAMGGLNPNSTERQRHTSDNENGDEEGKAEQGVQQEPPLNPWGFGGPPAPPQPSPGFGLGNMSTPHPPPPPPPPMPANGPFQQHSHHHHGRPHGGPLDPNGFDPLGNMHCNRHAFRGRGRGGRCGGRGRRGWGGFPPNFADIAQVLGAQLGMNGVGGAYTTAAEHAEGAEQDFVPPVDVFDTEEDYIVHVSLAGVKKEDVAVNWSPEKSELCITGVRHRPGDEELIKHLALAERKVGAFERKVKLGSRANPAAVDEDAITAKLEDGILRITVPKEDKEFVEVRKVDVQ